MEKQTIQNEEHIKIMQSVLEALNEKGFKVSAVRDMTPYFPNSTEPLCNIKFEISIKLYEETAQEKALRELLRNSVPVEN